jgi:hypothetical protein
MPSASERFTPRRIITTAIFARKSAASSAVRASSSDASVNVRTIRMARAISLSDRFGTSTLKFS